MRIGILCNDKLAIPATAQLLANRLVCAVAMPARVTECTHVVNNLCGQYKVPFTSLRKATLEQDLSQWLEVNKPDVVLVKTFSWKIPAALLDVPRFGFINFHYAPLPQWGGANPLFWMIKDGAKHAGLSIQQMTEEMDCGPLLAQQLFSIDKEVTYGMLSSRLAMLGAQMTPAILQQIFTNTTKPVSFDASLLGWYKRPVATDLLINWTTMDAAHVMRLVKACNPWNKGAVTMFKGWSFGITDAYAVEGVTTESTPGTILNVAGEDGFCIACNNNSVLRVDVIYSEEGFYSGEKIALFGLRKGDVLESIAQTKPVLV